MDDDDFINEQLIDMWEGQRDLDLDYYYDYDYDYDYSLADQSYGEEDNDPVSCRTEFYVKDDEICDYPTHKVGDLRMIIVNFNDGDQNEVSRIHFCASSEIDAWREYVDFIKIREDVIFIDNFSSLIIDDSSTKENDNWLSQKITRANFDTVFSLDDFSYLKILDLANRRHGEYRYIRNVDNHKVSSMSQVYCKAVNVE